MMLVITQKMWSACIVLWHCCCSMHMHCWQRPLSLVLALHKPHHAIPQSAASYHLPKHASYAAALPPDSSGLLYCSYTHTPSSYPACSRAFPLVPPDAAALAAPPGDAVQALWVGHASLLVQMEGVAFMTDPFFSQRSSPVQFLGPRRWGAGGSSVQ